MIIKKPMHAMTLAWQEDHAMQENDFSEVSDKLRDQLRELGLSDKDAAIKAPTMLEGIDLALAGKLDFKRIRSELKEEKASMLHGKLAF